ncbi:MAG: hypothetical protein AAB664_03975, partial [Patescibacteria group bacterium]
VVNALLEFSTFVTNRIAYEAAVYIANGGAGQGSMFYQKSAVEAWKDYGKEVAGEAIGGLSHVIQSAFETDFNLCVPPNPLIKLNLQIGIKQTYVKATPKCNFDTLANNWGSLWANAKNTLTNPDDLNRFLLKTAQESMRPGSNELGASIALNFKVGELVDQKKRNEFSEQLSSTFKPAKDFITGNIQTPASTIEQTFQKQMEESFSSSENRISASDVLASGDVWFSVLQTAGSTFVNTLASQVFNRVYKGLFTNKPAAFDPFNKEMLSLGNNSEATKKELSGIFTPSPIAITAYSPISEFQYCPAVGTENRGLNHCVIDADFASVVTLGEAGVFQTVKEAMDSGKLHKDWPLVPPSDVAANQDAGCFSGNYCYGNLVKLRKARIIPIGWELAALKSPFPGTKVRLKEVVDGFNNPSSPYYHLIDPNWVLKVPESRCRAMVNGELRSNGTVNGRQTVCADAPTCVGEDNNGKCVSGFGYCVQEKNVWRVRGDACPSHYATCLTMKNAGTGEEGNYLLNTVDNSVCSKSNAGCAWYKTQKHL